MNNSKIALDSVSLKLDETVDNSENLRERESQLVRIIDAIEGISQSVEWSTLKSLVFDNRIGKLEKQLKSESEKSELKDSEIYRLQGRLFEARKYDLVKLIETYRLELTKIRKTYE